MWNEINLGSGICPHPSAPPLTDNQLGQMFASAIPPPPIIKGLDSEGGGGSPLLILHPVPQDAGTERRVKEQILLSPFTADASGSDL